MKSTHIDSLACVKVKGIENEWFLTDSCTRQGSIIPLWLFNIYMDGIMKGVEVEN